MLEDNIIKTMPHRLGKKYALAAPIAVSAALHIIVAALLLSLVSQPSVREEIVEVFVIGEGGSTKPGINGETGPPGAAPASSGNQLKLHTQIPAQSASVQKPPEERMLEISRNVEPKAKNDMVLHTELQHKLPVQQKPSAEAVTAGQLLAALSSRLDKMGSGTGKNISGMGTGTGSGNGSAGFGSGSGGGGTGTGGILNTRFGSAGAPAFLYREIPQYPFAARRRREEGKVLLKLTIDEKGCLLHVDVIESTGADFTESAVEAIKRSRFSPAKKNNSPIMSMALLPIRFTLK